MALTVRVPALAQRGSKKHDDVAARNPGTSLEAGFASAAVHPGIAREFEIRVRATPFARDAFAYALIQRALDVILAGTFLVLAAPFLGLIALAIKWDSEGPILYRAVRIGRGGKPISVVKFRTMRRDSEDILAVLLATPGVGDEFRRTFKLRQDPRCTRIGRLLRRTSFDELPQFWNVLRGEMALVGPRPIVAAELDLYRSVRGGEEAYFAAKPGITGLWQISGRSGTSYRRRVLLDRYYAGHRSTAFDLWILAKTPLAVIKGDGAC